MSSLNRNKLRKLLRVAISEISEEMLLNLNTKKKKWVRNWIQRRKELGASSRLMKELNSEDSSSFFNLLRMSVDKFEDLLNLVSPLIKKNDTNMREAISCRTKLQITLRYLATGDSLKSLMYLFRVFHNTISCFLPYVFKAIYKVLHEYVKVPNTTEEWGKIQKEYENLWNFPNCCGSLDGKHIVIQRPANSTSLFFNYKGTYSIVLFAVVDADYCFKYIDVGSDGRASDSTIFRNSKLNIAMEKKILQWPESGVLLGDDAFPLNTWLLKPYTLKNKRLSAKERIFNYRLSRARRVVENAFGILAARFRIFSRAIPLNVDTIESLVKAACALHNWLRITSGRTYLPPGSVDGEDECTGEITPGSWREVPSLMRPVERLYSSNNYNVTAKGVRMWYTDKFMTDWAVPWQMKYANVSASEIYHSDADDESENSE